MAARNAGPVRVREVCAAIDDLAPPGLAYSWDNVGLAVNVSGDLPDWEWPTIDESGGFSALWPGTLTSYYAYTVSYDLDAGVDLQLPHIELNGVLEGAVPEPISVSLLGLGGVLATVYRRGRIRR